MITSSWTIRLHSLPLACFLSSLACRQASFSIGMKVTRRTLRMTTIVGASLPAVDRIKATPPAKGRRKLSSITPSPILSRSIETSDEPLTSAHLAAVNPDSPWLDLRIPPGELRCSTTLTTGQCFHWTAVSQNVDEEKSSAWGTHNATEWVGILRLSAHTSMVLCLRETAESTWYRVLHNSPPDSNHNNIIIHVPEILRAYFQLDESLTDLYQRWSSNCPRLAQIATCIPGVRVLAQDPWECLVSFLCSSNNNIPRITKMLQTIRQVYGEALITIGNNHCTLYAFPNFETLVSQATEADLRQKCKMGYRAKYLVETMKVLQQLGGESYLHSLCALVDPVQVRRALIQFCGIGNKVADCVALFSLNQSNAIPVDVHVWNICRRDYDYEGQLTGKKLTPVNYNLVGDIFRQQFPIKAGWAHSLLFVAELPSFRPILPASIRQEMDTFRQNEQTAKEAARIPRK